MKKRYIQIISFLSIVILATCSNQQKAWSLSLGLPDDQAVALQELFDAGMDPYEAVAQVLGKDVINNMNKKPSTAQPSVPAANASISKKNNVAAKEIKHEHSYTDEVTVAPNCLNPGVVTYTCECGDTYTEELPATGEHDYQSSTIKEPTCIEEGTLEYKCSVCGDTYKETLAVIEHDWQLTETVEPTCIDTGKKIYTCNMCDETREESIEALGHDEGEWTVVKDAGLFTSGNQELRCTRCNEVLNSQLINSKYPIWYLYAGIGVLILLGIVAVVVVRRKDK